MAMPVNPYVAGNPVGDSSAFVGRADVLREVLRVLRRPQDNAIVLFGQRRIGKTSILQHLEARLPEEGPYRAVYFDLQDKADWPLARVLQDLARTVAYAQDQPDPDLGNDSETTFREQWLPAVLDDLPEGRSLVLLFDEFDVLADPQKEQAALMLLSNESDVLVDPQEEQAAAAFFPYLRGLLASDLKRLQFVFVIGRNVDDLDHIALSLFKGTSHRRVTLLNRESTIDLVRLAEANDTLRWPDETVERVWELTNGHPYLTQQLCSHVWEQAHDEEPDEPSTVIPADVDAVVPDALDASRNTLEWLWDGLPPAERVVASALAEAGPGPITQEGLEQLLHESGVRGAIRELLNAPQLLQDWDLIEPADGGYRFRVELLRYWITEYKPLSRVQEELDHIEPAAENLYQAALRLYRGGQLDQAVELLHRAIELNPSHVRANQLLADILLAQGEPGEARQLLEHLSEYQPIAARSRLVRALLALAQIAETNDEQLALYERVLELDSNQTKAIAGRQRIWQQWSDAADTLLAQGQVDEAQQLLERLYEYQSDIARPRLVQALLDLAQTAGDNDKQLSLYEQVLELEPTQPEATAGWRYVLEARTQTYERAEKWAEAASVYRQLLAQAYDEKSQVAWQAALERCQDEEKLAHLFDEGVEALEQGNWKQAQNAFAEVIHHRPDYRKAGRLAANLLERAIEKKKATARSQRLPGWAWVMVGVLVIALAGGGGWALGKFQATPTPTPTSTVTLTAPSTNTSTPTDTLTPTSVPTNTNMPTATSTQPPPTATSTQPPPTATSTQPPPTATPTQVTIVAPELATPTYGSTVRITTITFEWSGLLSAGQSYQVTAYRHDSDYALSELLTTRTWTVNIPADQYGEWRWTVSVVQNGNVITTSSEWMFWFDPPGGEGGSGVTPSPTPAGNTPQPP